MATYEKVTDYDEEPVKYCAKCLSLKIKYEESADTECCGDCGCTDILEDSFDVWEDRYKLRYGHKFVEKSGDVRKSPLYLMSWKELKQLVYNHERWREIIRYVYPRFPENLSRIDSVILFFNKLIDEGRMNEFKLAVIKNKLLG